MIKYSFSKKKKTEYFRVCESCKHEWKAKSPNGRCPNCKFYKGYYGGRQK